MAHPLQRSRSNRCAARASARTPENGRRIPAASAMLGQAWIENGAFWCGSSGRGMGRLARCPDEAVAANQRRRLLGRWRLRRDRSEIYFLKERAMRHEKNEQRDASRGVWVSGIPSLLLIGILCGCGGGATDNRFAAETHDEYTEPLTNAVIGTPSGVILLPSGGPVPAPPPISAATRRPAGRRTEVFSSTVDPGTAVRAEAPAFGTSTTVRRPPTS